MECWTRDELSPHGGAKQLLADLGLLVGRNLQPVLGNERTGLHGRELAQILVLMASANLDEEDKGFGLVIELLLQDSGGLLKVSLGGYMKGSARRTWASTLQDELTIQDNLQLLQESLLIHDGRGDGKDFRVILFSFFPRFQLPQVSIRDSGHRNKD
jgi:hypothetical protein